MTRRTFPRMLLELVMGGPSRPFDLTVQEADLLHDALGTWEESYTRGVNDAAEIEEPTAADLASDADAMKRVAELRDRLRKFMREADAS